MKLIISFFAVFIFSLGSVSYAKKNDKEIRQCNERPIYYKHRFDMCMSSSMEGQRAGRGINYCCAPRGWVGCYPCPQEWKDELKKRKNELEQK